MKTIDVIFRVIHEATLKRDDVFYNEALEFYDKMINELEHGNYRKTDYGYAFYGSEINPSKYSTLLVLFIDENKKLESKISGLKNGYFWGHYNSYQVIGLNNIKHENQKPYERIFKESFLHEFIHYLDYLRSRYKNVYNSENIKSYYNNPREFNAYYHEGGSFMSDFFKKNPQMIEKFKEKYPNFNLFFDWAMKNIFDKDFIKHINSVNKNKLKKRLYNLYSEYLG